MTEATEATESPQAPIERAAYLRPLSITHAINDVLGVDWRMLMGRKRHQSVSSARVMCGAMLRRRTSMSLEEIGTFLGNRDHSTVMYYVDKCDRDMSENPAVSATYRAVEKRAEEIESNVEHTPQA